MLLKGKRVGFALTGSFCTFNKIMPEIEKIVSEGAEVIPIMSENAAKCDTRFGSAEDWKSKIFTLTGKQPIMTITQAEPIGPNSLLDVLVIAPCTGNTLGKLANGITDSSVTMSAKSHLRNNKPIVIAISTNDGLGANAKNLGTLINTKNIFFVPFGQDDPIKKCNSLLADNTQIVATILESLRGKQIQPILTR